MACVVHGRQVTAQAREWLGSRYKWGGNGPDAFDCSGFVLAVLRECGHDWPDMTAHEIFARCYEAGLTTDNLDDVRGVAGALVFRFDKQKQKMVHVAICSGQNETLEARSRMLGVGAWSWRQGWTHGARVPGVRY